MPGNFQVKEYFDPKLPKDFLKFKNIILEEKLSNKFKNGHEIFFRRKGFHGFRTPKTMETLTPEKFS
jgi:hypothetical protein